MRAPGCWYVNGNDEHVAQAELINATGNIYSAELFDQLLPQLPEPQTRRAIPASVPIVSTLSEIAAALDVIPTRVPGNGTYELYRNILWELKAAVTDAGYSEQVAIELMEAHSRASLAAGMLSRSPTVAAAASAQALSSRVAVRVEP